MNKKKKLLEIWAGKGASVSYHIWHSRHIYGGQGYQVCVSSAIRAGRDFLVMHHCQGKNGCVIDRAI